MKKFLLLTAALAGTAQAQPRQMSQHPRVGELGEIDFGQQSTRIAVNSDEKLGEIAGWARDNPDGLVVLDGHAARSEAYHDRDAVRLSLRRAEAVRDELLALAVDPDQIVIAAFGDGQDHGRAPDRDRRVVVWGTHDQMALVMAHLGESGAKTVEPGDTGLRQPQVPRPTFAGRDTRQRPGGG